ncbi:MAG: hypothetical protein R3315_01030 [Woeseiaceae bacterium]|nr:hypothetical protein [Woeseiaceae bacterium]
MRRSLIASGSRAIQVTTALAVAGLLGALPVAASAASGFHSDCGGRDAALQAESGDRDALDIAYVDLTAEAEVPPLDDNNVARETSAPLLFLGPRVATIVRDVFGDEAEDLIESDTLPAAATLPPVAKSPTASAPVASDEVDSAALDEKPYSPLRIHQEMYRTDI